MRLGMEIPREWLSLITPLTDIDFAIAHLVLEDEYYCKFYAEQVKEGRFVILDNGFHELGHPLTPQELCYACDKIKPSVVIAPDRLDQQLFGLQQFFELVDLVPNDQHVGAVLAGVSPAERAEFFMKVKSHCHMLCFPFKRDRFAWFCDLLEKIPKYIQWPPRLHLLGMSEFYELKNFRDKFDDVGIERRRISVDTSKPIKFGVQGKRFTGTEETLRGIGKLAEQKHRSEHINDVLYNIAFLRKYL